MFLNDPTVPTPQERLVVEASVTVKDATSPTIGEIEMAKGKSKVLVSCNNPQDTLKPKVSPRKGTKENKPNMNGDSSSKGQPTIQNFFSPSKPRSPLSENSILLIQEEKPSDNLPVCSETSNIEKVQPCEENPSVSKVCPSVSKAEDNSGKNGVISRLTKLSTGNCQKEDASSQSKPGPVPVNKTGRRKVKVKKAENKTPQNKKVTDYYPIRRSTRKSKAELLIEEQSHIDTLIKNNVEEGLHVRHIEGKGRGVFAAKLFKKGEFVVEYHGDLLNLADAKSREALYAQDPGTGCYMYYFQYLSKTYCVDATKETNRLGRLINHSSKNGNCHTKLHDIDGTPHLILLASRDIQDGEELLYDYGDRSKSSISAHPWLKY